MEINLQKIRRVLVLLITVLLVGSAQTNAFASETIDTEITYYNQGDYKTVPFNNGTVSSSGCGITSFAIVASTCGVEITPEDVAGLVNENGTDYNTVTNHEAYLNLAEYYGISTPEEMGGPNANCCKEAEYDKEYLLEKLNNGYAIILSQTGGYFNPSGKGHYTVLYGMGENGPLVYDPGSQERTDEIAKSNGYNDWDSMFSHVKHIWIFQTNASLKTEIQEYSKETIEDILNIINDSDFSILES